MSDESWHEDAGKTARVLQIIVCAMCAGVAAFLVVTLFVATERGEAAPVLPIPMAAIVGIAAGVAVIARTLAVLLVTAKSRRAIAAGTFQACMANPAGPGACEARGGDERCLLAVFQMRTIIGGAIFEGVAFLAGIGYMLERSPICLALAVLLLLGVAAHFPTQSGIIRWVERQLDVMEQEKRDNAI